MEASFRSADPSDRPSLEIIRQQAIETAYADQYDRAAVAEWVTTPAIDLAESLGDARWVSVLAETEVTAVGFALADPDDRSLAGIFVAPDYQRRGYGSALLERVEGRFRRNDVSAVTVIAPDPVTEFFASHGFEPSVPDPARPVPAIRMRKRLRAEPADS